MSILQANELPNERIIAIDGTSGSGKSTLARGLSKHLGLHILETGSLYRAVTLLCLENQVDVNDENAILNLIDGMHFRYENGPYLDDRMITDDIRSYEVTSNVSLVSLHAKVREQLTQIMRHWIIQHGGGVVEGRDITTVVAPYAKVRVFVDAPQEIRAQRRQNDTADNIDGRSEQDMQASIAKRDEIDSTRIADPLRKADGVLEIDSSKMTPEEMVELISKSFHTESID